MLIILNLLGLFGAIKVLLSSTVKNAESVFLKNYILKLLNKIGVTNNGSLIFIEGNEVVYASKTNSGVETIKIININNSIQVRPFEKIAYVALEPKKLKYQLFLQKYFYKYLYFLSGLFNINTARKYLKDSFIFSKENINKLSLQKLSYTKNKELSVDSWLLGNIQYSFNEKSEFQKLSFENLLILKSSLGFNKSFSSYKNSKNKETNIEFKEKKSFPLEINFIPKKVLVFYIDNVSYFLSDDKYLEKNQYPLFSDLFKKYKLENFKFSSTTNWTFPAAVSIFSGKKYNKHMIYHRNHRPYYSINNLIRNYVNKYSDDINDLRKVYKSMFVCGTNWRMHQHHGLSNIFNHLLVSNPKFADIYDVIPQVYKQLDIAGDDYTFHWINFMDSHHPVKDSILPVGALKNLNLGIIEKGLQYETGPKFDKNLKNKTLPKTIYYSQIDSVAKAIDNVISYSYLKTNPDDHLIILLSDHGSSFCSRDDIYSKILEKHTPMLSISSNYIQNIDLTKFKDKRFSHFGFFKLIKNIINQKLDELPKECFSNFSQIIFPDKPYEFFYFEDKKSIVYNFKSFAKMPKYFVDQNNKKEKDFYTNSLKKGIWTLLSKKGSDIISEDNLPKYILNQFNKVLPFS